MGFTTGLLGGFTLTTTLIYLSLNIHTHNRIHQAALLQQQALNLNNIVDPLPPAPPVPSRAIQAGLWDTAKDRWNHELESNIKKLYSTDWGAVRDRVEIGAGRVWRRLGGCGEEWWRRR